MTRGNSDLIDLTLQRHAETKLAILVSDDGDAKRAVWLPLSQVEVAVAPGTGGSKGLVLVTLPEWLATERGLV
jgi:hypothetical protein